MPYDDPTLDWNYVLGGSSEPTYTAPTFTTVSFGEIVEPPPAGYPKVIVHPEKPNAPFFLISPGWYRSPTNEVVSYRTVAEYLITANAPREQILRALGQTGPNMKLIYIIAGGVGILVLISLLVER